MDPRRERELIVKHVRYRNREESEHVVWYGFQPLGGGGSLFDDVYDEGAPGQGGKEYDEGVFIPTLYIEEIEDSFREIDKGRQPVQAVRLTLLYQDVVDAGVKNPREYRPHLNDVFEYDYRFYKVQDYRVRGRLHRGWPSGEVLVLVTGYEVFTEQEMPFSLGPANPLAYELPWPNSLPN